MEKFEKFTSAIKNAQNIVITTHLIPDADGIGSEISLCLALRKIGKQAICCNEEELLERYRYLDPGNTVIGLQRINTYLTSKPDLIIVVDTNTIFRTGANFLQWAEDLNCPILYIDHHPCTQATLDDHCIDTKAAATGQLVGELIEKMGVEFDQQIALPLYTAILIDTSSFRYPTVTAKTHELIAKLMATGINPPEAYNGIYGTKNIQHLHMLGQVLMSTHCNESEQIAWIVLDRKDLEKFKIDIEDTHAFINHLLILDKIKVACMFRDDGPRLKVSLRSSGDYDVGLIATALGGGGHSHSAATLIVKNKSMTVDQIIQETISKIESLLKIQEKI
jgi:bifunctional oligoribonuclease and PAP phosphatase NrnA